MNIYDCINGIHDYIDNITFKVKNIRSQSYDGEKKLVDMQFFSGISRNIWSKS